MDCHAALHIKILGRSSSHIQTLALPPVSRRTGRAFGTVLAALGEVEAFLLVPLRVVKHAEVVAGRDGGAVALTRVDVVDVVEVALGKEGFRASLGPSCSCFALYSRRRCCPE